ncbi:DUF692 domain-containing protein [Pseudomonas trivialis]|uniref:UPF0276 protein TU79_10020 n=2 Tax=Pseudomonas trivialis TaxID=200450 RepID=A0A0R2ZIN1_9PSED|nr:DUF692 domain-containing protein [Pseudomonas trivialis]KRP60896.1 hypothetical protein TU79_10020 [Pseudomonas trivialis]
MMTHLPHHTVSPAQVPGLPLRAGLGLKSEHFIEVLETRPDIGFFEVHAENYMVAGGPFHHYLGLIREQYPLSLHGVSLSIGGEGPLDCEHLARLATLIERYQPQSFSEHLAWSSHGPVFLNDLLPLTYDATTLNRVCAHIDQVQSTLKRPMLLENPSTYLLFQRATLDEPDFISEVVRRTGCGLLLDVNNVYVSCINHQRDPVAYIDALPLQAVGEIHLAGFAEDTDSLGDRLLIDDHGAPIDNAVWQLYEQVLVRTGPVATLIERDNQVPAFNVLQAEAQQAERLLSQVTA